KKRSDEVMRRNRKFPQSLKIYTDGAIRPDQGTSGLAAIARDEQNQIFRWWYRRVGRLTCNEAEYAAAIFALDQTLHFLGPEQVAEIAIYSDSRVMVDQMSGRAEAHAPGLQAAKKRLQALVEKFKRVTFHHISREQNRLADALAFEAVSGPPRESQPQKAQPNLDLWKQFESTWRES
ncbi:MAG: ribonuclease HI family protein, partial [Anaerolineales bacterium]|nr:ribonuclease HI family protein [Anaerolineales bacterium]